MKYLIQSFLLLIVGALIVNNSFYLHIHQLASGELIVHAHPFDKAGHTEEPVNTHEHKSTEILFFSSLLILFTLGIGLRLLIAICNYTPVSLTMVFRAISNIPLFIVQRAPPVQA